jgi:sucrose phosphorylase
VNEKAFHPNGEQQVLTVSPSVFSVMRISPDGEERILALINVTSKACDVNISVSDLGAREERWNDLISEREYSVENQMLALTLQPYDVVWLKAEV